MKAQHSHLSSAEIPKESRPLIILFSAQADQPGPSNAINLEVSESPSPSTNPLHASQSDSEEDGSTLLYTKDTPQRDE